MKKPDTPRVIKELFPEYDDKPFEDEHQVYYPDVGWFLKVHPKVIEFLGLEGEYLIQLLSKNKL